LFLEAEDTAQHLLWAEIPVSGQGWGASSSPANRQHKKMLDGKRIITAAQLRHVKTPQRKASHDCITKELNLNINLGGVSLGYDTV
jgi:hypothetical protein